MSSYKKIFLKLTTFIFVGLYILLSIPQASAHSSVLSTFPKDGQRVESFDGEVSIKFNQLVGLSSESIKVVNANGQKLAVTSTIEVTPEGSTLYGNFVDKVPNGWYALLYNVSAADGHPATGTLTFLVGPDLTSSKASINDPSAPYKKLNDILRFLGYLTALMSFGLLLTSWVLEKNLSGRSNIVRKFSGFMAFAALIVAPLTLLNFAMLLNAGSTDDIKSVVIIALQSAVGTSILIRVSSLFALATAILLATEKSTRKFSYLAGVVGIVGIAVSFAYQGHSTVIPNSFVARILLVTHLIAAGSWLGGIPGMYWFYRNKAKLSNVDLFSIIKRFSILASVSVFSVLIAGTALGVLMFTKPSDITTKYGYSLLAKFGLVCLVALMGAYNHFKLLPSIEKDLEGENGDKKFKKLKNSLKAEAVGFIFILLATTFLTTSGAPAAGNDHGLVSHGHGGDSSTSFASAPQILQGVLGDGGIEISLAPAVMNQEITITAKVTNALGKITPAQSVVLYFTNSVTGVGPIERELTKESDGSFTIKTRDLAISGEWEIKAVVALSTLSKLTSSMTAVIAPDALNSNNQSDLGFESVTPIIQSSQSNQGVNKK